MSIGDDCLATSITAGIDTVNGVFGDADDDYATGCAGNAIVSRIASITIGRQLIGTLGGAADRFGIEAQEIGAIKVHGVPLAKLTAAKDDFLFSLTGDVRVREFA